MALPGADACYLALRTRDARFDGRLFVGVRSTGIYCRPVCPAITPKPENCQFYPSAAAAQLAGFRPCLRCRPETSPDQAAWHGTSNTVSRALSLIAEGALDGGASVDGFAARLGVGERQLRRLFHQHLGASPIAIAQTRRILFAKQLIHETQLPISSVAFAAGFASVRRFNEVFRRLFQRPPSALRRRTHNVNLDAPVTLRLRYCPPYDWDSVLAHLAARALTGVEVISGGIYRRTASVEGHPAVIEAAHDRSQSSVAFTLRIPGAPAIRSLSAIVGRLRRLFDLDSNLGPIRAHLRGDPMLGPLLDRRPGLRIPGTWDSFELTLRAVLGQQVTIQAARQLGSRLVQLCGQPLPVDLVAQTGLTHIFPSPTQLLDADLGALGMPSARRGTLHAVALAAIDHPALFDCRYAQAPEALADIRGIGPWTLAYIGLRAFRDPDAFPASDVALLHAATRLGGSPFTPAALLRRAAAWSPWRAYAAQHLWTDHANHDE